MINPFLEKVFTLTAAAKSLPERRRGKKPDVSCIYRWATKGCKGVVLETIQIGGTRCTSQEALARFFAALTGLGPTQSPSQPQLRSPAQRDRDSQRAIEELKRQGI